MDKQQTELTPCKCFRCGSVDRLIAKCPIPFKDNKKLRKTVRFNERGNHASQIYSEDSDNYNNQKIYASMAWMSGNDKSSSRYVGDSSKLTN